MDIAIHLGAHCTDDEGLVRCLLRNRGVLAAQGIAVPGPARYRTLLRDASAQLGGQTASADTAQLLLDEIVEEEGARRVVLSFDSFMAFPRWAIGRNQLYPGATDRTVALAALFPGHRVEFHLAIRDPATFLPALFERQKGKSYAEFTEGCDPAALAWSDLVARIRAASPAVPLTVWCDEDTPLIWPDVLRTVSGHAPSLVLEEADTILEGIMSPEGFARMQAYLASHPPQTGVQRRRIVSAFLDKFSLPERIEMELDLPGWDDAYVAALSAAYDADCLRIARMPGVRFIAP
ncbi:MAG: hypothetical protein ACK4TB_06095 [Gemmobacter sp.]